MNDKLGTLTPEAFKTEPKDNLCLICVKRVTKPMLTHSFICENGGMLTYFYRTHKKCWVNLSETDKWSYESSLVDSITQPK